MTDFYLRNSFLLEFIHLALRITDCLMFAFVVCLRNIGSVMALLLSNDLSPGYDHSELM